MSSTDEKKNPGQIAAEAFYADNRHLSSVAYNCDTSASWDRVAAAVLEHCAPIITTEQHAALLRRIADQQRALDEARGNLAIVARMLADAVGGEGVSQPISDLSKPPNGTPRADRM